MKRNGTDSWGVEGSSSLTEVGLVQTVNALNTVLYYDHDERDGL